MAELTCLATEARASLTTCTMLSASASRLPSDRTAKSAGLAVFFILPLRSSSRIAILRHSALPTARFSHNPAPIPVPIPAPQSGNAPMACPHPYPSNPSSPSRRKSRRFSLPRKKFHAMEPIFAVFPCHGSHFSIAWKQVFHTVGIPSFPPAPLPPPPAGGVVVLKNFHAMEPEFAVFPRHGSQIRRFSTAWNPNSAKLPRHGTHFCPRCPRPPPPPSFPSLPPCSTLLALPSRVSLPLPPSLASLHPFHPFAAFFPHPAPPSTRFFHNPAAHFSCISHPRKPP